MGNYRSSATIKYKDFEIGILIVKMQWGGGWWGGCGVGSVSFFLFCNIFSN